MVYSWEVPKLKKTQLEPTDPQMEKRDIMTEMFEHFGIKVIEVTSQNSKFNKRKVLR